MKYAHKTNRYKGQCKGQGMARDPNRWMTGPDPLTHDKHYAFLKHRAQANHRGEDYHLTFEDWLSIWSDDDFLKRGRGKEDLCLYKIEIDGPWDLSNVQVGTRMEYLSRGKEYRDARSKL